MTTRSKQVQKLLSLLGDCNRQYGPLIASRLGDLLDASAAADAAQSTRTLLIGIINALCHCHRNGTWNARLVSGQCLEVVARRTTQAASGTSSTESGPLNVKLRRAWLQLDSISVDSMREHGTLLLSRAPKELIEELETGGLEVRLDRQRKQLLGCLGQAADDDDTASSYYGGVAALLSREDITPAPPTADEEADKHLSARMRNYKRRARSTAQRKHRCAPTASSAAGLGGDQQHLLTGAGRVGGAMSCDEAVAPTTTAYQLLLLLTSDLVYQLFHQTWECRHGAALALLGLLRAWLPTTTAATELQQTTVSADITNVDAASTTAAAAAAAVAAAVASLSAAWAEDIVARCLGALALDRFGDYSAGGVVAPVRETTAQVLGLAASMLSPKTLLQCLTTLRQLCEQQSWEARHGAQLGVLYIAALACSKASRATAAASTASANAELLAQQRPDEVHETTLASKYLKHVIVRSCCVTHVVCCAQHAAHDSCTWLVFNSFR
jgi:hypothetical protein